MNFYNTTKDDDDKSTVCWMKYRGPKHVLVNTTNNCMTEVIEWATDNESVRAQYCVDKEDELKTDASLWTEDTCGPAPHVTKRVIQDREVNGLHRIYCYPYNSTIEQEHMKCPDHVFELEERTNCRIANMQHSGQLVEQTVVKTSDLHLNREILSLLKAQNLQVRVLNTTELDAAYLVYFKNLQNIPRHLNFTSPTLAQFITAPFKAVAHIGTTFMRYLKTFGIIIGALVGLFLLAVLMPVIELVFASLKVLKVPIQLWFSSNKRMLSELNLKLPKIHQ